MTNITGTPLKPCSMIYEVTQVWWRTMTPGPVMTEGFRQPAHAFVTHTFKAWRRNEQKCQFMLFCQIPNNPAVNVFRIGLDHCRERQMNTGRDNGGFKKIFNNQYFLKNSRCYIPHFFGIFR